jgi:sporulation protein YlmC with PRC-barrel domain
MNPAGYESDVVGRVVLDAGGERIGEVSSLYLDTDTNVVSFAGVAMTRRGRRRVVFVPLDESTLGSASITVRCGKELARRAPSHSTAIA